MFSNKSDHPLVDAARRIVPIVREHADQAEHERRLPAPVAEEFRQRAAPADKRRLFSGEIRPDRLTALGKPLVRPVRLEQV